MGEATPSEDLAQVEDFVRPFSTSESISSADCQVWPSFVDDFSTLPVTWPRCIEIRGKLRCKTQDVVGTVSPECSRALSRSQSCQSLTSRYSDTPEAQETLRCSMLEPLSSVRIIADM